MTSYKKILMIAFHYPPCSASSGIQRTLALTRYLPRYDWQPALVSVRPFAYTEVSTGQINDIPKHMPIRRAFTLDAARHLAFFGKYPARLAVPDRWRLWKRTGLHSALAMIREFQPDAVWSTYPVATAHSIAAEVAQRAKLPWVADMRDPMVEHDARTNRWFPADERLRHARLRIESDVMSMASGVVFCTDSARAICVDRYGAAVAAKTHVIENGFDELTFRHIDHEERNHQRSSKFCVLHSGTVYPGSDRGPEALLAAISQLDKESHLPEGFRLTFRATGHDEYVRDLIERGNLAHLVNVAHPVDHYQAVKEMRQADVLVVLQGHTSNTAIPAKVYEYLRARRPILALVDPRGETAKLLSSWNVAKCVTLDDILGIRDALLSLFGDEHDLQPVPYTELMRYSREHQTADLAELLDRIVERK